MIQSEISMTSSSGRCRRSRNTSRRLECRPMASRPTWPAPLSSSELLKLRVAPRPAHRLTSVAVLRWGAAPTRAPPTWRCRAGAPEGAAQPQRLLSGPCLAERARESRGSQQGPSGSQAGSATMDRYRDIGRAVHCCGPHSCFCRKGCGSATSLHRLSYEVRPRLEAYADGALGGRLSEHTPSPAAARPRRR